MPRKLLLEVAEAARAVEERLDQEQRPAVADAVERRRERGGAWLCHARNAYLCIVTCNLQVTVHGSLRMNAVTTLQDAIAGAAERVGPSVVGLGRGWGHGSGVVIADGHVLTSAHNLRRDEVTVSFADGRRETGDRRRRRHGPRPRRARGRHRRRPRGELGAGRRRASGHRRAVGRAGQPRRARAARDARLRLVRRAQLPRPARAPHPRRDRAHRPAAARLVGRPARGPGRQPARRQQPPARRRPDPRRAGRRRREGAHPRPRARRGRVAAPARRGDRAAAGGAPPPQRGRPARSATACWCAPSRTTAPAPRPASSPAT